VDNLKAVRNTEVPEAIKEMRQFTQAYAFS
jgi:hypothetical protein